MPQTQPEYTTISRNNTQIHNNTQHAPLFPVVAAVAALAACRVICNGKSIKTFFSFDSLGKAVKDYDPLLRQLAAEVWAAESKANSKYIKYLETADNKAGSPSSSLLAVKCPKEAGSPPSFASRGVSSTSQLPWTCAANSEQQSIAAASLHDSSVTGQQSDHCEPICFLKSLAAPTA
jgi:hypothetical protein